MQPHEGPLNWDFTIDLARKTVAGSPDPTPSQKQKDAVADALTLADHWLDGATGFPSGVTSTAAWSRAEWIVATTDVWKVLVEPIAESSERYAFRAAHFSLGLGKGDPGQPPTTPPLPRSSAGRRSTGHPCWSV